MFDAIWAFLKDPTNREALGWSGTGIVVVVSGLWTIIKFRSKKEKAGSQPSVQASKGGVAVARDMIGNKIDTGGSHSSTR
jgi:hypothetical protein